MREMETWGHARVCLISLSSVKAYSTRGWGLGGDKVRVWVWWCGADLLGIDVLDGLSNVIYGNDGEDGPENLADF